MNQSPNRRGSGPRPASVQQRPNHGQSQQRAPLTPQQMNLPTADDNALFPVPVVSDGKPVRSGITFCGVDEAWVTAQAAARGYTLQQIFLMTCTSGKDIHLVPKEEVS